MSCLIKIQAEIKTSFGKIVVEGSTINEVVTAINSFPENLIVELERIVLRMLSQSTNKEYEGIVKVTEEGPILVLKDASGITQYEAIALTLYFSKNRCSKPSTIRRLLEYSGIKLQVSSRLNEMAKRGLVFKPIPGRAEWALSPKGERWVEEEVLPKLKEAANR
ncbi:MAG: hypothetical protein QXG94_02275 [Candidatus Bathyarchaeia archaeon]